MVHDWTRRWWESLPHHYRKADNDPRQAPERPLLRFMDGIGQLGGAMRGVSDDVWEGLYTDPARIPDSAVRWLAQMLGVPESQRATTPDKLRAYLQDLTVSGRPAVGTRSGIAEVAKRYLTGDKQVYVTPSETLDHTLIVYARADEIPGGELSSLAADIRAAGVIPAGHNLEVRAAVASWDAWEAATGETWDQMEAVIETWTDSDSAGVQLE